MGARRRGGLDNMMETRFQRQEHQGRREERAEGARCWHKRSRVVVSAAVAVAVNVSCQFISLDLPLLIVSDSLIVYPRQGDARAPQRTAGLNAKVGLAP